MSVIGFGKPSKSLEVIEKGFSSSSIAMNTAVEYGRFAAFWDLMSTVKVHGYVRAAMSVIGRSTVGTWWALNQNSEFKVQATERKRKKLLEFYMMYDRQWDNIKDFYSIAYKMMIAAMYLKYFGQAAFQIVRNNADQAIGFDFLNGLVIPNVDEQGYFQSPAFKQYPTPDRLTCVEYASARDIVFIVNPDWEGSATGGSDMESLTDFALPLDIYLQTAARNYMKNRDRPEVVYQLASDIDDEAFTAFTEMIREKYSGAANVGRNPVAVKGDLKVIELSKLPSDLPYQEARKDTRTETFAVTGVTGAKLGVSEDLSSANLRELRREFFETSMLPLFRMIEMALYEQVHIREFDSPGWDFKFDNPDFLTAVETATVHMRYHQVGALNPNEIRADLGMDPREGGEDFVDTTEEPEQPQGSPPEGREDEPDAPANTGEPTLDDQDPPRGDNHDDETRMYLELKKWRVFALRRLKKGRGLRRFESPHIPLDIGELIQEELDLCGNDPDKINEVFDGVLNLIVERVE